MRESMAFNPSIYQLRKEALERMLDLINKQSRFFKVENLFFGDSIFAFWDVQRFFKDIQIANCGIVGATTDELMCIVDEAVIKYQPKKVFIHVGTNDLGNTVMHSPRKIAENIALIVQTIKGNLPNCLIYVISPLPCIEREQAFPNVNGIRSNAFLKYIFKIIPEYLPTKAVKLIDIFDLFCVNGHVNTSLYRDGLHLNEKGYKVMGAELEEYLKLK